MRGGEAATAGALHRRDRDSPGTDRRAMAGDGADSDMVLGDDLVEDAVISPWAVAPRPCPLGHRERLLQHVGDALGLGPRFKHTATAIVNFLRTLFLVYALGSPQEIAYRP